MSDENEVEQRMIDFKCPYCGQEVSFLEMNAGLPQDCAACAEVLIVPEKSGEAGQPFPLPFATERLTVRRLHPGDREDLCVLVTDEQQTCYETWYPLDEAGVDAWLEDQAYARLTRPPCVLSLGIETTENQKLIGFLTLRYLDDTQRQGQINVLIGRDQQRKGYGLETIRGLLGFGFRGIHLRRIIATCDSRNDATIGLLSKAGFRKEGESIEDHIVVDGWANTTHFAMRAREHLKE